MGILKNLFGGKKEEKQSGKVTQKINSVEDFWNWFITQEKEFHKVIKDGGTENITENFFNKLEPKLDELKLRIKYLTGMLDDGTADLILTADGYIPNFYVVEELVTKAPKLENWLFQAHKPAHNRDGFGISMGDFNFDTQNISFYSDDDEDYPDEINLVFVHDDFSEENADVIKNGTFIFLENYIGELNFATMIDNVDFIEKQNAEKELVPLNKLNDFLIWREKEFVEKYEREVYDAETANYSMLEATLNSGNPLMAVMNMDLLQWDSKASHPWILEVVINYEEVASENGFPDEQTMSLMNDILDDLTVDLKDKDGYLEIGRETAEGKRYMYFACKEYLKPCKVADRIIEKYKPHNQLEISQECYKDKYWRSFERFMPRQ